jgi:hypothetical protein
MARREATLHPLAMLRELRVKRAIRDYPLYDPPHKVEERLLSREQALENFEYFMRHKEERVAYFHNWIAEWFGYPVDTVNLSSLIEWTPKYAALLMPRKTENEWLEGKEAYYTYKDDWCGDLRTMNAVFDFGTAYAEYILTRHPTSYWGFESKLLSTAELKRRGLSAELIDTVRERQIAIRAMKNDSLSGFWRPCLIDDETSMSRFPVDAMARVCIELRRSIIWGYGLTPTPLFDADKLRHMVKNAAC